MTAGAALCHPQPEQEVRAMDDNSIHPERTNERRDAETAARDDAEWITPRVTRLELETAQATF